jgi:hypothetical protein
LARAIKEMSNAYGLKTRTLEKWIQWPGLTDAGVYPFEPPSDVKEAQAAILKSRVLLAILTDQVDRIKAVQRLEDWWKAHRAEIEALMPEELEALKRHHAAREAAILESRSNAPP